MRLVATLVLLLLVASCGTESGARPDQTGNADNAGTGPSPTTGGTATRIELAAGAGVVRGQLEDTRAGRDFAAMLPLTLTVSDFHATEKISHLPRPVTTDGAPAGTTPAPGDISFYTPWGNLALFYRDFGYSPGLVRLGRLDPGGAELLAALDNGTTISITTLGQTP
jgi:hypothetical protein